MNEYGSQFKPDETITNIVFLRAMVGPLMEFGASPTGKMTR